MEDDSAPMEIDDSLYSRQRYVLGDNAMLAMARSDVFISGMGGLGVEIAKNIILAGVKSVTVHDTQAASMKDLSSQFYLTEEDVASSKNRAVASHRQLKELNPYVEVKVSTVSMGMESDLNFLSTYQCVIFTDAPIELLVKIDSFCRSQTPPIKFIAGCVRGVFSCGFCDFGEMFEVMDHTGEEPAEFFISGITKANPAVVSCLENERHGLEDGDGVLITEVKGMEAINNTKPTIKVLSPSTFSIDVDTTSDSYQVYQSGGLVRQLKLPTKFKFEPLSKQLHHPLYQLVDFTKIDRPPHVLLGLLALDQFQIKHQRMPKPRHNEEAEEVCSIAEQLNKDYKLVESVDKQLTQKLSYTSAGYLPPLASVLGGVLAQECLIALTGKFSPLQQWLFLDCTEVFQDDGEPADFTPGGDRYGALRVCLGEGVLTKLASLKLFMVGCGAIGCEMLKNYAMLGIGRGRGGGEVKGSITVTDNDIIEKSNLNRQFLFRDRHIQSHKSEVAAQSTREINPDLNIEPQRYKVFPGTESVYSDEFFHNTDVVVNALDNLEARRYVDSRCVTNLKPLLESGTMGTKGHVQVILPELTESYSSQQDPPDKDVPYCTLKSFPANIEHTIQWARDKFESLFSQKPALYSKFWQTHNSPVALLQRVDQSGGILPDGTVRVMKMLSHRPHSWRDCVCLARVKFEKYFNHKARHLIHAFPLDTKMPDGSLFWQLPKRPPSPIQYSQDPLHIDFVTATARLYADICGITYTRDDLSPENISAVASTAVVPDYKPSSKRIETDVTAKKPESVEESTDDIDRCHKQLHKVANLTTPPGSLQLKPLSFEKDDDSNGHIDFITAASNLRALMYGIDCADRFKTKRIAGRIVPAIATTTAAVAGLVSLELIKVAMGLPLESHRNAFMNLALLESTLILSEPAAAQCTVVSSSVSYTLWTKWDIRGDKNMTLKQFLQAVEKEHKLTPSMVVYGVKMIYVPIMPGHRKRLPQSMVSLIKPGVDKKYVDLTLSFENEKGEDIPGPPVRFFFRE